MAINNMQLQHNSFHSEIPPQQSKALEKKKTKNYNSHNNNSVTTVKDLLKQTRVFHETLPGNPPL